MGITIEELRVYTKEQARALQWCHGALGTHEHQEMWTNRWEYFFENVSAKSLQTDVPTGEDVVEFLYCVPKVLTPQHQDQRIEIGYTVVVGGICCVIKAIRLRHDSFRLTYAEQDRIKSALQDMINKGLITKNLTRDPQWLSAILVS